MTFIGSGEAKVHKDPELLRVQRSEYFVSVFVFYLRTSYFVYDFVRLRLRLRTASTSYLKGTKYFVLIYA